jgi:hypothetical protein
MWLAIVATRLANGFLLDPARLSAAGPVLRLLARQAVIFAALAAVRTLGSWRSDLVEPREVGAVAAIVAWSLLRVSRADAIFSPPPDKESAIVVLNL